MGRPTISLALIAKNEERNIRRLLDSVENCFDEIILVDTGSTDLTKSIALAQGCKVFDFKWCDDFSKARNEAFGKITSEFGCWLDLDDVLDSKEKFIQWRDYALEFADYWLAPYHYTLDKNGKPLCTFLRERVVRMSLEPKWNYFVHEGISLNPHWRNDSVHTWAVKHLRTEQDFLGDKGRNLKLLEANRGKPILAPGLDARMQWYLGKEYYDHQKFEQALTVLVDVLIKEDLQIHDRILAIQFAAYSAMGLAVKMKPEFHTEKLMLARNLAQQGLCLDPKRAEFYCLIGETYLMLNDTLSALPYYSAAENCITPEKLGAKSMSPIFTFAHCYEDLPKMQKARIYMSMRQIDLAEKEILECLAKYPSDDASKLLDEIRKIKPILKFEGVKRQTSDIVFSCPPHAAYPFDEEIYRQKGLGGSETALVQMAKLLREKTGRRVLVFNVRDQDLVGTSGVEWVSNRKLNEYMSHNNPAVHIAWRHNIKVTQAKTYLWAHDLLTPTVEMAQNFDKMLCLSEFHKQYTMARCGVPAEKIILTRNGIPTENFTHKPAKNPNKLVWLSSLDRGIINCIPVLDLVREKFPDIELHVYYGLENLYNYGLGPLADELKKLFSTRPWIKYHGFTEQKRMHKECADAVIWPHTANFIETHCLSAIEAVANGIYPVTRNLGALPHTLKFAKDLGMATLLDHDAVTPLERQAYANAIVKALEEKSWEHVNIDLEKHDWAQVADEWLVLLELEENLHAAIS